MLLRLQLQLLLLSTEVQYLQIVASNSLIRFTSSSYRAVAMLQHLVLLFYFIDLSECSYYFFMQLFVCVVLFLFYLFIFWDKPENLAYTRQIVLTILHSASIQDLSLSLTSFFYLPPSLLSPLLPFPYLTFLFPCSLFFYLLTHSSSPPSWLLFPLPPSANFLTFLYFHLSLLISFRLIHPPPHPHISFTSPILLLLLSPPPHPSLVC